MYSRLNKVLYIILGLIGYWGTYTLRHEVHIFWIVLDFVSWTVIAAVPWILPMKIRWAQNHEKRV